MISRTTLGLIFQSLAALVVAAACSSDDASSPADQLRGGSAGTLDGGQGANGPGASGQGATGQGASSGTAGTGGTSGTTSIGSPRRCGMGEPCRAGAKCRHTTIESGHDCECDPSGHFFCDYFASAGAGGAAHCPRLGGCGDDDGGKDAPSGTGGTGGASDESCTLSNGYCTRTCSCPGGCTMDCSGAGPATGPVHVCDPSYCASDYGRYGGCVIEDGSCVYSVDCHYGTSPPTVTGSCE